MLPLSRPTSASGRTAISQQRRFFNTSSGRTRQRAQAVRHPPLLADILPATCLCSKYTVGRAAYRPETPMHRNPSAHTLSHIAHQKLATTLNFPTSLNWSEANMLSLAIRSPFQLPYSSFHHFRKRFAISLVLACPSSASESSNQAGPLRNLSRRFALLEPMIPTMHDRFLVKLLNQKRPLGAGICAPGGPIPTWLPVLR
ncbi:hypothetical protein CGRA01v4_04938 [Colletotrichum graminicola]|nr:hypothetical protein CGRA01v4_04938 [Colletotrichum graminicola]